MKRFLFFLMLFVSVATNVLSQANRYKGKQIALIAFNLNINSTVKPDFDSYAHLFPEVENKRADRVEAFMKERIWYYMEERIEREIGTYILPVNTHGKNFSYDIYGFPDVTIRKAIRSGDSRFYLKVDFEITSAISKKDTGYGSSSNADTASLTSEKAKGGLLPQVTIDLTFYNDKGVSPVQKVSASITASELWFMSDDIFAGFANKNDYNKDSTDTLMGLLDLTISKLIRSF